MELHILQFSHSDFVYYLLPTIIFNLVNLVSLKNHIGFQKRNIFPIHVGRNKSPTSLIFRYCLSGLTLINLLIHTKLQIFKMLLLHFCRSNEMDELATKQILSLCTLHNNKY